MPSTSYTLITHFKDRPVQILTDDQLLDLSIKINNKLNIWINSNNHPNNIRIQSLIDCADKICKTHWDRYFHNRVRFFTNRPQLGCHDLIRLLERTSKIVNQQLNTPSKFSKLKNFISLPITSIFSPSGMLINYSIFPIRGKCINSINTNASIYGDTDTIIYSSSSSSCLLFQNHIEHTHNLTYTSSNNNKKKTIKLYPESYYKQKHQSRFKIPYKIKHYIHRSYHY